MKHWLNQTQEMLHGAFFCKNGPEGALEHPFFRVLLSRSESKRTITFQKSIWHERIRKLEENAKFKRHVLTFSTSNLVIFRRCFTKDGKEMYLNEKCTSEACRNHYFFSLDMQICDVLVRFLCLVPSLGSLGSFSNDDGDGKENGT